MVIDEKHIGSKIFIFNLCLLLLPFWASNVSCINPGATSKHNGTGLGALTSRNKTPMEHRVTALIL